MARSGSGMRIPAVYFGYTPGVVRSAYPLPHSFAKLRLWVFDRSTGKRYGHHIDQSLRGGFVSELQAFNGTDSTQTINYHLEISGRFPETYSGLCLDGASKRMENSGSFTVAPASTVSRWIVAGDAAFRRGLMESIMSRRFKLHPLYPNPARSFLHIRYTVPFGAQETVGITVYNVIGRKVWEKRSGGFLEQGEHVITWDGRDMRGAQAGSGLYIVRLTVMNPRHGAIERFERCATLLR